MPASLACEGAPQAGRNPFLSSETPTKSRLPRTGITSDPDHRRETRGTEPRSDLLPSGQYGGRCAAKSSRRGCDPMTVSPWRSRVRSGNTRAGGPNPRLGRTVDETPSLVDDHSSPFRDRQLSGTARAMAIPTITRAVAPARNRHIPILRRGARSMRRVHLVIPGHTEAHGSC